MLLPDDDSFDLDATDDNLTVDRNNIPAPSLDELKKLLPAFARGGSSVIRDAFLQMWGQMANVLQGRYGLLAAQGSPRFAEGVWLDALGQLLGRPKATGESDPDYRHRLLTGLETVTPVAIKTVINNLVAGYLPNANTTITYVEPALEQFWLAPATASDPARPNAYQQTVVPSWSCFFQPQVQASGAAVNQSVYAGKNIRLFMNDPTTATPKQTSAWWTSGSPSFWVLFQGQVADESETVYSENATTAYPAASSFIQASTPNGYASVPESLINLIVSEVEHRRAGGVSWTIGYDLPKTSSF